MVGDSIIGHILYHFSRYRQIGVARPPSPTAPTVHFRLNAHEGRDDTRFPFPPQPMYDINHGNQNGLHDYHDSVCQEQGRGLCTATFFVARVGNGYHIWFRMGPWDIPAVTRHEVANQKSHKLAAGCVEEFC
jgi:hypothetical protein